MVPISCNNVVIQDDDALTDQRIARCRDISLRRTREIRFQQSYVFVVPDSFCGSRARETYRYTSFAVDKSTHYLLSLEPVKGSGRWHVAMYDFARV